MYISGALVAFGLAFIVYMIQGIKRNQASGESIISVIPGVLFGSIMAAFLSWLAVVILGILLLFGKVWGISDRNL